ncbi:unnamed protein product [Pleuronectes platessa]|uniref:Secreted protein n=1 Tax=Pleuronectes platessa TaxID=8262 RepID=A0A9N7TKP5_PLEPL|nr:unnamed protein product [Pleuronectes platessa]
MSVVLLWLGQVSGCALGALLPWSSRLPRLLLSPHLAASPGRLLLAGSCSSPLFGSSGSSFSRIGPNCRACECFPPLPVAAGSDQLIDRVARNCAARCKRSPSSPLMFIQLLTLFQTQAAPPQHPGRMCTGMEKHSSHL